ncbi:MAG TPA: alpha-amylase family glycosyl hydrolase [Lachnospiraceae bacterium]|nr:alpha-amylase family glycosyl hydrolase [Lachnospiraceae bacterium]
MRLKKILSIMSFVLIMTFTACSKSDSDTKDATQVAGEGGSAVSQEDSSYVEYTYNQDLNIIDDLYRTYYEVFLYSYYDSNGDGIGDINGLISKLDYLNDGDNSTDTDLGITGIWLMPIMPSTTYHKYDVIDYYGIDPQYGTIDDFKKLIAECDRRGIKVIIDLVLNHTSTQCEWFQSAIKSLAVEPCGKEVCTVDGLCREHNKYCGYYNFEPSIPTSGTYYPTGTGEWYYEAMFWDQMPDLNLANKDLRADLENVMSYWLDLGVGGFRLDAAKEFYSGNPEKNIEVLKWINDYVKGIDKNNYLVAEVWDSFGTMANYYSSGIDSLFNFPFSQENGKIVTTLNYDGEKNSGSAFGRAMVTVQDKFRSLNENAIDASFFTNHDTARASGYFSYNEDKIKMAAGMNLMMAGNSFIYYGEELGMTGSGKDENKRAPMYWSATNPTGMTVGPPSMDTVEHEFGSLEDQVDNPLSIYNYYKRAVRLRNENPEIARGTTAIIESVKDVDICAITRTYNDSKVILLYNISEEAKEVTLIKSELGYEGIRGYLSVNGEAVTIKDETVTLPPYSIAVLK